MPAKVFTQTSYCGKKAETSTTYTGMRAEHDMKGSTSIVISRLRGFSMVRVAMTAGTLQPNPITMGMNDLPCRPMRCISLYMMKAARAM